MKGTLLMKTITTHLCTVSLSIVLACFALSPMVRAADGGLLNGNTAEGSAALLSLTMGSNNTAMGDHALAANTTGNNNTATGTNALQGSGLASFNTATGASALSGRVFVTSNSGNNNTATGFSALELNASGSSNTATGALALSGSITSSSFNTGNDNTATGFQTLLNNTTGGNNTATGSNALIKNGTGSLNTATGSNALESNIGGNNNTATGVGALVSNTTGSNNVALGFSAGSQLTTGSNNIDISNHGVGSESNAIRIGTVGTQTAAFIAGIHSAMISGTPVVVSSTGQLGVAVSSERFKEAIKPMDKASETILSLKPVTFRYKKDIDPAGARQFGLVAEQVDKVDPDLVVRDKDGKIYSVRYEAVNAMLLNEFLNEHRQVQQQQKEIDALKAQQKEISALRAQLREQAALISNITNRLELSKTTPKLVLDNL
jgi:hypothetical protein